MKAATLSGRKRTKDLSNSLPKDLKNNNENTLAQAENTDPVISKKYQLNKLKSEVEPKSGYTKSKFSEPKKINPKAPNLKLKIATLVRFFKSNAQAGTRNSLKYTIEQQKYILLDKISEYIKEYSEYGQKAGWAKSENLSRCQEYANQIYYSLSEAGAPLNSLVVTDPMS